MEILWQLAHNESNAILSSLKFYNTTLQCFWHCKVFYTVYFSSKMGTHTHTTVLCRRSIDSGWFRDPLDPDGCVMSRDVRDASAELEDEIWWILDG